MALNNIKVKRFGEKIDERYFKKGIEELISCLQHVRTTTEHNYAYSLLVLKYYRDFNNKDFLEWFDFKKIKENNILSSEMPNSFLITSLIFRNEHFSKLCVKLFADIGSINDYYISDCMIALHKIAKEPETAKFNKKETVDMLLQESNQRYKEIYKKLGLYTLIETLEDILFILRKLNIDSYEKLEQAYKDEKIQKLLKKLESIKL